LDATKRELEQLKQELREEREHRMRVVEELAFLRGRMGSGPE
jgi:hypothetical protein